MSSPFGSATMQNPGLQGHNEPAILARISQKQVTSHPRANLAMPVAYRDLVDPVRWRDEFDAVYTQNPIESVHGDLPKLHIRPDISLSGRYTKPGVIAMHKMSQGLHKNNFLPVVTDLRSHDYILDKRALTCPKDASPAEPRSALEYGDLSFLMMAPEWYSDPSKRYQRSLSFAGITLGQTQERPYTNPSVRTHSTALGERITLQQTGRPTCEYYGVDGIDIGEIVYADFPTIEEAQRMEKNTKTPFQPQWNFTFRTLKQLRSRYGQSFHKEHDHFLMELRIGRVTQIQQAGKGPGFISFQLFA